MDKKPWTDEEILADARRRDDESTRWYETLDAAEAERLENRTLRERVMDLWRGVRDWFSETDGRKLFLIYAGVAGVAFLNVLACLPVRVIAGEAASLWAFAALFAIEFFIACRIFKNK